MYFIKNTATIIILSIMLILATMPANAKPCDTLLNYSSASSPLKFLNIKCEINNSVLALNSSLHFSGREAIILVKVNYSAKHLYCEIAGQTVVFEKLNSSQYFMGKLPWHLTKSPHLYFANEPLRSNCYVFYNGSWLKHTPDISGLEFCELCFKERDILLFNSKTCTIELRNASSFEIKPSISLLGFPLLPVIIIRSSVPYEAISRYLEITIGNTTIVTNEKEFETILGPQEIVGLVKTQGLIINYSVSSSYKLPGNAMPCRHIIEKGEGKLSLLPYLGNIALIVSAILFLLLIGVIRFRKVMRGIDVDIV
ncbi:MAG TPA: hypothetical protein ENI59_02480 [Euryarchaeota archaeon]|nr:hypothetical protein [Euryarchaeota archaeon]